MKSRNLMHLGLTLLLAAGLGVFAGAVRGQTSNSAPKKAPTSKPGGATHSKKSTKKSRRRERGQKAPTPERISEIQQALAKDGSFTGKPNGKWDESTIDAMKRFQETHGLNATGKLDAKTLQQLGLGSSIAGVAAPQLPANNSKLTNPARTQSARKQ
ncbi:MAG TPA: peptidoglycan-binding domain-containing protein [Candidatus Acidoferrum sp.]|nr:peptidoglycan-binding domain-containing protein [Candidatus Acidoferrum sp.]